MITLEQYHRLRAVLERLPAKVIWDVGPAVAHFRAQFGSWDNTTPFVEEVVSLLVEFATDPQRQREPFEDYLSLLYSHYDGITSPLQWQQFLWLVQALGVELLGRLSPLQLRVEGQMLYRYEQLLADDVVLRKLYPNEFDELVEEGAYDTPVGV